MGAADDDDRLLLRRVEELARPSAGARFLGFLDPRQRALAQRCLDGLRAQGTLFWGGWDDAERVFLGAFPEWEEPSAEAFPVARFRVSWRGAALSHRDFLGSLLSLGLARRAVGDLLVGDGVCDCFLDAAVAPFVTQNLAAVGGAGVSVKPGEGEPDRQEKIERIEDTVASARLDCIVAALTNASRAQAAAQIEAGLVRVDFAVCDRPAHSVPEGARISVRGHGRFFVEKLGPPTRKGRLRLVAQHSL